MDNSLNTSRLSRRQFGKLAGLAGLAVGASPGLVRTALADTPDSAQIIAGKASGLIVHNADLGVMETPLAMLRKFDHTPKDILFNRFHYPASGRCRLVRDDVAAARRPGQELDDPRRWSRAAAAHADHRRSRRAPAGEAGLRAAMRRQRPLLLRRQGKGRRRPVEERRHGQRRVGGRAAARLCSMTSRWTRARAPTG